MIDDLLDPIGYLGEAMQLVDDVLTKGAATEDK